MTTQEKIEELTRRVRRLEERGAVRSGDLLEEPARGFRKCVAEMPEQEMRDRLLRQASHITAYQKCLDGLGLKTPGSFDGHRRPKDIRGIVKALVRSSNAPDELPAR